MSFSQFINKFKWYFVWISYSAHKLLLQFVREMKAFNLPAFFVSFFCCLFQPVCGCLILDYENGTSAFIFAYFTLQMQSKMMAFLIILTIIIITGDNLPFYVSIKYLEFYFHIIFYKKKINKNKTEMRKWRLHLFDINGTCAILFNVCSLFNIFYNAMNTRIFINIIIVLYMFMMGSDWLGSSYMFL